MEPLVSIIIPSRSEKDDVSGLLQDISRQAASFNTQIIRINGIAPPGRARNMGSKQAKGQWLVFIDCDIHLGDDFYLAHLIEFLDDKAKIGATCASLRLPLDASFFQRCYARQVPHCQVPIVELIEDVFMAPSACFAITKELFFRLGGFNEEIIRGEDSEFSMRLKEMGYRIVLAPKTWCYHAVPGNFCQLIKANFRNGAGVSFVDILYPALNIDVHPRGITYTSGYMTLGARIKRFIFSFCQAVFKMKVLLILSKIIYSAGYFYGIFKYKFLNKNKMDC